MERRRVRADRLHCDPTAQATLLARLRDVRFSHGIACPRCRSGSVTRWGSFSGRQRYRCGGCNRTFSDLTGTPAAYLKKLDRLPEFGRCLKAGLSVRRSADQLALSPSTVFRWRHRLWAWQAVRDRESVGPGWVELMHHVWPHSHKGARRLPHGRLARRRGQRPWLTIHGLRVHLIVACDRRGGVVTSIRPPRGEGTLAETLSGSEVRNALGGRVADPFRLTGIHSSSCAYGRLMRRQSPDSVSYVLARSPQRRRLLGGGGAGPRTLDHVRTAWAYLRRLRVWLERFRGVASKYLPHYMLWHRWVDRDDQVRCDSAVIGWPLE